MLKTMAKGHGMAESLARSVMKNAGELQRLVEERTGFRIRDVLVELGGDQIVLRGQTPTFHIKQLAQEGILDVFPNMHLVNAIEVRN
ncbi:MAG TPA: hypothetical protein VGZ47_21980 [Gemmataceae bacterium]|nr:hypothetical protein [Gemmataceae bacterium]